MAERWIFLRLRQEQKKKLIDYFVLALDFYLVFFPYFLSIEKNMEER